MATLLFPVEVTIEVIHPFSPEISTRGPMTEQLDTAPFKLKELNIGAQTLLVGYQGGLHTVDSDWIVDGSSAYQGVVQSPTFPEIRVWLTRPLASAGVFLNSQEQVALVKESMVAEEAVVDYIARSAGVGPDQSAATSRLARLLVTTSAAATILPLTEVELAALSVGLRPVTMPDGWFAGSAVGQRTLGFSVQDMKLFLNPLINKAISKLSTLPPNVIVQDPVPGSVFVTQDGKMTIPGKVTLKTTFFLVEGAGGTSPSSSAGQVTMQPTLEKIPGAEDVTAFLAMMDQKVAELTSLAADCSLQLVKRADYVLTPPVVTSVSLQTLLAEKARAYSYVVDAFFNEPAQLCDLANVDAKATAAGQTTPEYLAGAVDRAKAIGVAAKTPSWWSAGLKTLLNGAKSVGSKAFDYVTKWKPQDLVATWAGYEAVKSVKASSIPTWLLMGGAGLLALMILK